MKAELIAPCGMNCSLCSSYLAYSRGHEKKRGIAHCTGCRIRDKNCSFVKKRCPHGLSKGNLEFCHECQDFPCENLQKISNRYEKNYNYNFIENLEFIRDNGMDAFLEKETKNHKCSNCEDIVCIHDRKYYKCQTIKNWKC